MFERNSEVPGWLSALLTEKFFNACLIHEYEKRNEKNVFCFDCCDGICPHCLIHHRSHRLFQIRRYVYNNVIKLVDAETLLDCAQVQTYTSNGAKVVFLKERHQTRPTSRGASGKYCINCDRNVQDSYLFCSLSCKLQDIIRNGKELSIYLRKCEFPAQFEPGLHDGQMTPDSVLEPTGSIRTESSSSCGGAAALSECLALTTTATTEVVRKKRSNSAGPRPACRPVSRIHHPETTMNRRKGTPQRAPLF